MAAYNSAGTIDQALASIAMQTLAPAEVVVADDASGDDTVEVAGRWAHRLPLRVLTTSENGGPSVARDRAIEGSRSALIAAVDADDLWLPDHLETLLALHRAHGGVALCQLLRWAPGEGLGFAPADLAPVPPPGKQLRALYLGNFACIGTLFERSLYQAAGGFRPSLRVGEEWDLYIRMLRIGARIHRAGHPTLLYRMRPGSLMWTDAGMGDRLRVLELARAESQDPSDLRTISRGLRRLEAEQSLKAAYHLASEGHMAEARRAALGARRGHRRVAVRGAAMVLAPRATAARRHQIRSSPALRIRG
ncbi:MAG: glycosyltransferase family 2 protein [Acidimicrobiales bacterium]